MEGIEHVLKPIKVLISKTLADFNNSPLDGAISVTFKHIILYTGEQHSKWLRAKWFPYVFIGTDFVAIFIQAAGAGLSAGATGGVETDQSLLDVSSGILIAGVAFQLA